MAVAAGVGFGEYGDDHVRIGFVENEQRTRQAVRNVKKFLSDADRILANYDPNGGTVVQYPGKKA